MTRQPIDILIVEDEPAHAEAIRRALLESETPVKIRLADSLSGFHEAVALHPPDLVLLDLLLPDGRADVALVSPPEAGSFPVVVMTSHGDEQVAVSSIRQGALDYVVKSPHAFANMPRTVERTLREWQTLRESRQAQRALAMREEIFSNIVSQAADAIVLFDTSTARFVEFNTAAHEGLGYTREEFSSLGVPDIQPDHSLEVIEGNLDEVRKRGELSFETRHLHRDGSFRDVWVRIRPLRIQEDAYMTVVWTDITEKKRAEAQSAREAMRTEFLLELHQCAPQLTDKELFDRVLERAVQLTESSIGFFHRISEDQSSVLLTTWNQGTLRNCTAIYDRHYPLEQAGNWVDCVRRQQPVVYNDYSCSPNQRGLPPGHIPVHRFMSIPVVRDGRVRIIFGVGNKAKDYTEGDVQQLQVVANEVHKIMVQRENQDQLRQSEERFRQLAENINQVIWVANRDVTEMLYVSPAFEKIWGIPCDSLYSDPKSWLSRIVPEDLDKVVHMLARRGSEGHRLEYRIIRPDGAIRWISDRGFPVRDGTGEVYRFVGIAEDITEHKRMEKDLDDYRRHLEGLVAERTREIQAANEEQQAIFEAAAAGIVFVRDRVILRCNHKLEEIFGYGPGEFIGRTTRLWYSDEATFSDMGREVMEQLKHHGMHHCERRLVRKDGSTFWARMAAQPIDPSQSSKGLVGMIEDISGEREAQEALLEAKARAEAATQAKSAFLANMSHEIRTPMNAIVGFAHLLKRDPLTPGQLNQLNKMSNAATHLLQIINDILDFSKIEADKITLESRDFEPARVIDRVCNIISDKIASKSLDFIVDMKNIPFMLRGDDTRLGQVLLNLVSNAEKFTVEGGITITVRNLERRTGTAALRFEVRDTGIGMTDDQIERLFYAFEQADSSTTRRFGGTGLGLAICKRLVEMMGGRIGVESRMGQGTLFWLEIPFEESSRIHERAKPMESIRGMRGLVIDDLEDAREILATMLTEFGLRVDTASSGEAGLAAVLKADQTADPYGLLILDWKMQGLTGIETAYRLRSLDLTRRPAYLMVTAYGEELSREEAMKAGINRVLTKPVTPSVLFDALVEILGQSSPFPLLSADDRTGLELAKRHGSIILLVEDNAINQEVASQLLESMGMKVCLAENGQIAVEMAKATSFDLILMDVQMPVMDGLQATEIIRRIPGRESTPVLAMTAGAFDEDIARCFQAGMNDHVAKPVEPKNLRELLVKWLPVRNEAEPATGRTSSVPSIGSGWVADSKVLALLHTMDGLDVSMGLRPLLGDVSRYIRLLGQFVERHGGDGELLIGLMRRGELETVRQTAHTLKGVAGLLGAREVQRGAADLEKGIREAMDTRELRGCLDGLVSELDRLITALRGALAKVEDSGVTGEMDWRKVTEVLEQLESLLAVDDTSANDVFEQWGALLVSALGDEARRLGREIQDFDYADALETLHTLRKTGSVRKNGH